MSGSRHASFLAVIFVALVATGCGDDAGAPAGDSGIDAGRRDAGTRDAAILRRDAGVPFDASLDAGPPVDAGEAGDGSFCSPARLPCGLGIPCCPGLFCSGGACSTSTCGGFADPCDMAHPCCPGTACTPSGVGSICTDAMCAGAMEPCGGTSPSCCAGLTCARAPTPPSFMACVTCRPAGSTCGAGAACCPGTLCRPDPSGSATCR